MSHASRGLARLEQHREQPVVEPVRELRVRRPGMAGLHGTDHERERQASSPGHQPRRELRVVDAPGGEHLVRFRVGEPAQRQDVEPRVPAAVVPPPVRRQLRRHDHPGSTWQPCDPLPQVGAVRPHGSGPVDHGEHGAGLRHVVARLHHLPAIIGRPGRHLLGQRGLADARQPMDPGDVEPGVRREERCQRRELPARPRNSEPVSPGVVSVPERSTAVVPGSGPERWSDPRLIRATARGYGSLVTWLPG